jgi:hypothetical protein
VHYGLLLALFTLLCTLFRGGQWELLQAGLRVSSWHAPNHSGSSSVFLAQDVLCSSCVFLCPRSGIGHFSHGLWLLGRGERYLEAKIGRGVLKAPGMLLLLGALRSGLELMYVCKSVRVFVCAHLCAYTSHADLSSMHISAATQKGNVLNLYLKISSGHI